MSFFSNIGGWDIKYSVYSFFSLVFVEERLEVVGSKNEELLLLCVQGSKIKSGFIWKLLFARSNSTQAQRRM